MAHKTWGGLVKATERAIEYLNAGPINDDREYRQWDKKTSDLSAELSALWSNPGDAAEARKLRNRLVAAWNKAIGMASR